MISLEPYHQTYTYDIGNNLTMRLLFLSSLNTDKRLLLLHSSQKCSFSLKIVSIKLDDTKIGVDSSVFLYLKPEMPLISAAEPLPPRGNMQDYFAPDKSHLK
jgi:hypothetical protein